MVGLIIFGILVVLLVCLFASCVKIVPQAHAYVVERLGAYQGTWSVGMHIKMPIFDKVERRVVLKEQVVDFAPQPVITKDNVTMQIDTIVFYQITDPKLFTYGVENPIMAIENLTATTLRNIIGELELDQTLTSRETINTKMRASLDEATDPWGIKVNRVELKNIIPPAEIQNSMERQMKAERERREAVTRAEGEKKASVTVAEGKKAAAILEAEAEKQSAILRAEDDPGGGRSGGSHHESAAGNSRRYQDAQRSGCGRSRVKVKESGSFCESGGRSCDKDHYPFRDTGDCRSGRFCKRDHGKINRETDIEWPPQDSI